MIPVLNPFAEQRFRNTRWGNQAEMRIVEAEELIAGPMPTDWVDLSNRASALYLSNLTDEALEVATKAVEQARTVMTLVNMSVILETMGRFEEALPYQEEACLVDPEDNRAQAMYGEALLRLGRFKEGWPLYATERAAHDWIKPMVREWEGQDLAGKRLLVIEGGGYGDNIYFLRWLDQLRKWGAKIDYVCQPPFAPLVRYLGYNAIENWAGNLDIDYPRYDYFTSVLALGWKLGITLDNYIWTNPYINVRKRWHWGTHIGICWRAGEGRSPRKQRSLTHTQVEQIIDRVPTCQLVNLTYGQDLPIPIGAAKITDWMDTAYQIAGCDLVISVDTGVAHLAGAMGVPVWVILPGASAWQYPLKHNRHPLYPSMRCFWNQGEGMDTSLGSLCHALENYDPHRL